MKPLLTLPLVLVCLFWPGRPCAAQGAGPQWQPGGSLKSADKQRDEIKKELAPAAKNGDVEAAKKLVEYLSYKHQYPRADAWEALCDATHDDIVKYLLNEALFDKSPDVRADIIEVFEETADKRALPYLVKLAGNDKENRQLIYSVLGEMGGSEAQQALAGAAKKERDPKARAQAIEALARLDAEAAKPLAREGATVTADWQVRVGSLRALAAIDEDGASDFALGNLRHRRAEVEKKRKGPWQPAYMAIKVLKELRTREKRAEGLREAIDILIALLDKDKGESGRMKHEVLHALRALTGKLDIDDQLGWQTWWEVNRERYEPKDQPGVQREGGSGGGEGDGGRGRKGRGKKGDKGEPSGGPPANGGGEPAGEAGGVGTTVRFHGIPILSDRVAFVIDSSGSMEDKIAVPERPPEGPSGTAERDKTPKGPTEMKKLELSKEELGRTIAALPDDMMFNVVVYGTKASPWQKALVPAQKPAKATATSWVNGLKLDDKTDRRTNYFAALKKPLEDEAVDCIFFLTDGGVATEGRYINHDRIIRRLWDVNKYMLVEVNCILFGAQDQTQIGSNRRWLEKICNQTGGKFYVKP